MLYQGLKDRLFDAEGDWDLKKCPNRNCGLIWLDPMPLEEDIHKAYVEYYTHQEKRVVRNKTLKYLFRFVKEGYWGRKYGYCVYHRRCFQNMLGNLIYLFPFMRAEKDRWVMYLPANRHGRLLDIGCGSGESIRRMQEMGWRAEGIDFDRHVIDCAKRKGLIVNFGSVQEQGYPDDHFDAITMMHVIEHVSSPLIVLKECYRILKPGGRLVVETPNSRSLGHCIFKKDWRGLEPPRHLHLMNMAVLKRIVTESGFDVISTKTLLPMSYMLSQSYALRKNASSHNGELEVSGFGSVVTKILSIIELVYLWVNGNAGEVIVLVVKK